MVKTNFQQAVLSETKGYKAKIVHSNKEVSKMRLFFSSSKRKNHCKISFRSENHAHFAKLFCLIEPIIAHVCFALLFLTASELNS